MSRKLLWKFLLIIATGTVALFSLINYFTSQTEAGMKMIDQSYRDEITSLGRHAELLFHSGDQQALSQWLKDIQQKESTEASIVEYQFNQVAGNLTDDIYFNGYHFGRNVDWPIHLDFKDASLMEVPFEDGQVSFLIALPDRMKPGSYLPTIRLILQVLVPFVLLSLMAIFLYRHIMQPLMILKGATRQFSKGDYTVRACERIGKRDDELTELASTFDNMATRIGNQIVSQRQLIADLSHELRTPLTRLDIAVDSVRKKNDIERNIERLEKESGNIRRLVNDSLALAWLENEEPQLEREDLDLVDLLDVIIDDAKFEFPHSLMQIDLPDTAPIKRSNHLAIGQAVENILRNALRYSPTEGLVKISLDETKQQYQLVISDSGPGVPDFFLEKIFQPFFRVDKSRKTNSNSFGLGLSLARRQLHAVGGDVIATNIKTGGLSMIITLPKNKIKP